MPDPGAPPLSGRRAEAARNDQRILHAAREVLVADPDAAVSVIAERAGVGMSAIYRRFTDKEDMIRRVCHDGLQRYAEVAEEALEVPDGWEAFRTFLEGVVDADVHSLTVRLAGRFDPTEEMFADSTRAAELTTRLVNGARRSGRLRDDFQVDDVTMLLELMTAVRAEDPERTHELRRRYLTLLLDGLSCGTTAQLPGPAPTAEEFARRWERA